MVRTIATILASDTQGLGAIEVMVVDDGSPEPVDSLLRDMRPASDIRLSVHRQENAGPALARNTGFRLTSGELVLFVDDDIDVPPGLLRQHLAAHERFPGTVICGRCVLDPEQNGGVLHRTLDQLGGDPGAESRAEFEPVRIVASGQLSVERRSFGDLNPPYCDRLRTGAEDIELSHRLVVRSIPALRANQIVATHRQPLTLASVLRQQYWHGLGYGEAAVKVPETLAMPELRSALASAAGRLDGPRACLRRAGATRAGRATLAAAAAVALRLPLARAAGPWILRMAIGASYAGGIRAGLARFAPGASRTRP